MTLEELLKAATPGPWVGHNMIHADEGRQMTPEEIGEYVCNSVKMGSLDRFLFVSGKHDDGEDADVCHTGNGPRGPANTALIALAPTLAAALVEAEKALAKVVAASNARNTYHALPNDRNRIGEPESPKSRAKRVWLRALNRSDKEARAALARIRAITGGGDE